MSLSSRTEKLRANCGLLRWESLIIRQSERVERR